MFNTEEKFWTVLRIVARVRVRQELQKMEWCSESRLILDFKIEPKEGIFRSRSRRFNADGVYISHRPRE